MYTYKPRNIIDNFRQSDLSNSQTQTIQNENLKMAQKALRVLGVAYKYLENLPAKLDQEVIENNMTFVGLIGMKIHQGQV